MKDKIITLAIFDNTFDIQYNLLKNMLDEANIKYFAINENLRHVEPMAFMTPTNISIEIKIFEQDLEEATAILNSIL